MSVSDGVRHLYRSVPASRTYCHLIPMMCSHADGFMCPGFELLASQSSAAALILRKSRDSIIGARSIEEIPLKGFKSILAFLE